MKKSSVKNCIVFTLFLAILLAFVVISSRIVTPKRYDFGANWSAYQQEEKDSMDVLFFGSSLAYCNLIPAVIYEDSGIASYIMAGPCQTTDVTYYYVKEALKTQHPQVIFVEASNIMYDKETGRSDVKINLCYYPYGADRIAAMLTAAPKKDHLGLLFPLYNYHDRWQSLTRDDWKIGLLGYSRDLLAGYTFLSEAELQSEIRQRNFEQTDAEYQENLKWFIKINDLCTQKKVRCFFYITANYAYFAHEYQQQLESDLRKAGAQFLDHTVIIDELSLDPGTDFKDILHFNYRGAEKYSHKMASVLQELGIQPQHLNDAAWQERSEYYHQRITESLTEDGSYVNRYVNGDGSYVNGDGSD